MRIVYLIFALALLSSCDSGNKGPYNVVILFTDDQRFNTIHAWGNEEIITPNMDRLSDEGISFTRAHVAGSIHGAVCAPSRAMLLSGRSFFHIPRGFMGGGGESRLPFITMPELYRQAGYNTFFTGKWHNDTYLINQAFTHASHLYVGGMHWPRDGGHDTPLIQPYDSTGVYPSSAKRKADKFSSVLYTDAAIEFLQDHGKEKPFMMYVSYTSPHDPRMAPEKYTSMYNLSDISLPENFLPQHPFDNGDLRVRDEMLQPFPRTPEAIKEDILAYYAMVTEVDANIGRFLDELESQGLSKNTIVVFAGDNGLAMGQHGLLGKQSLYDHSSRVPLIFRGPGIKEGENNSLVYLYDVFPTLCELTGLEIPESVEGSSLVPAIEDNNLEIRDHIFTAYRNKQRAIRTKDDLKLLKYNVNGELHTQMFDIGVDPWETENLSKNPEYQEEYNELSEMLVEEILIHGDEFLTPQIKVEYSDFGEPVLVSVTRSFDAVRLYYTMDGSVPTTSSMEYPGKFSLDTSTTISVKAFYNTEPVSDIVTRRIETIDWLADATLDTTPSQRYKASGIYTLVDKERGTMSHGNGQWLGFQDNNLQATIDLGTPKNISRITLGCLSSPGSWIFYPERLKFFSSNDGSNWQQEFIMDVDEPLKNDASGISDFGPELNINARYIKLVATPLQSIPEWHDGSGSKGWLFVDELLIETE